MKHYEDLNSLIREDMEARRYFDCLPDHVKESVRQRAQNVNSLASLRDYAENLTRGDD